MTPLVESSEVVFTIPLAGFPSLTRFVFVKLDDGDNIRLMKSVEDPSLSFLVIAANTFYPDYVPDVDDESAEAVNAGTGEDIVVLFLIKSADSLADCTVNMQGPLLLNVKTRQIVQAVVDDPSLSMTAPLIPQG